LANTVPEKAARAAAITLVLKAQGVVIFTACCYFFLVPSNTP
jgi:hypothetical protein